MSINELESEIKSVKRMLAYNRLTPNQITNLTILLIELQSSLIALLKKESKYAKAS